MLDEHRLAHTAPGDERDDRRVRLCEDEVEQREFLLAANQFFRAEAGAASERELVEVKPSFGWRAVRKFSQSG